MTRPLALALLAVVSTFALGTVACGDGAPRQAAPTPSATSSAIDFTALPPEPVGPVPQGVLVVQKESQSATTFGIAADGSIHEFGQGVHFETSPDGRSVAVHRGERPIQPIDVVIFSAAGRKSFEAKAPEASRSPISSWPNLSWSSDGSQLAYTLPDETKPELSRVYRVNADGSGQQQVTPEAGNYNLVGWAAGGQILVHSGEGLVLMGTKYQTLAPPEDLQVYGEFQMSPDERYVAFLAGDWEQGFEMWLLDVESGESRLVAEMGQVAEPERERYVSAGIPMVLGPAKSGDPLLKGPPPVVWSPDGSRIAYYRSETDGDGAYRMELRVVDVASGRDIGLGRDAWPAQWSKDGRYLAAVRQAHDVVLLRPDGSTSVLDVRAAHVLWSDSGVLVAAHPSGVSLVDINSGEAREALTADGGEIYGAELLGEPGVWSPDGSYLAFSTSKLSHHQADSSLYVLDTMAGNVTLIVDEGHYEPMAWLNE